MKKNIMTVLMIMLFAVGALFAMADFSIIDSNTGGGVVYDATLDTLDLGQAIALLDNELIDFDGGVDLQSQGPVTFQIRHDTNIEYFEFQIQAAILNASTLTNDFELTQNDLGIYFNEGSNRIELKHEGTPIQKYGDGYISFFDSTGTDATFFGPANSASIAFGSTAGGGSNDGVELKTGTTTIARFRANTFGLDEAGGDPIIYMGGGKGFEFDNGNDRLNVHWDDTDSGTYFNGGNMTVGSKLNVNGRTEISGELNVAAFSGDGTGKVLCLKSDGDIGTCTDAQNVTTGLCTCA